MKQPRTIEVMCSPVRLNATVFIKDENGISSHKVKTKELSEYIDQVGSMVDQVTIYGPMAYTKKIKSDIEKKSVNNKFTINLRSI